MVTLDGGGGGSVGAMLTPCFGGASRLATLSWVQRSPPEPFDEAWRIVPDDSPHLIHHVLAGGRRRTRLVGPRSRFLDISWKDRVVTVGVRLRPGVLTALLAAPAWELRDRSVPVEEAFGASGVRLAEQLAEETDPHRLRARMEAFVAALGEVERDWRVRGFLARTLGVDSARTGGAHRVRAVARDLGVGERSLREVLRTHVGLRPKETHRIRRLHWALDQTLRGRRGADVAWLAGYADHAHFVREAGSLLGMTPAGYRARRDAVLSKTRRPARA